MTVICTDGHTIACDSQETGAYIEKCRKLYKLGDGRICGTTGDSGLCLKLIDWVDGEISSDDWYYTWTGDGYAGLLVVGAKITTFTDGTSKKDKPGCWLIESDTLVEIPVQLPAAVGSGGLLAMGAMEHGATPEEAVKIAIKRDPYCMPPVTVWDVPR